MWTALQLSGGYAATMLMYSISDEGKSLVGMAPGRDCSRVRSSNMGTVSANM